MFLEVRLGRPEVPLKTLYIPYVSGGAPRAPRGASRKPFIILVFLKGRLGRPEVPLKNLYNPCVSDGAPLNPIKTYQKSMETYGNQAKSG